MDVKRTIRLKDGKPWLCKSGHVMGVMKRERIDGFRGYILYFLTGVHLLPELDLAMDYAFRAQGTVHGLLCQYCGAEKTWWAAKAAINPLLQMGQKKEEPAVRFIPVDVERCIKR